MKTTQVFTKYTLTTILCILICALCASAQTTTVTATVTDPNSVAYANGSYFIQFSPNPSFPTANYNVNGVPINRGPFSGATDATGTFTQAIADNGLTNPKGSSWIFTICNYGSSVCFTANVPVTGGSANLSSSLSAVSVVLTGNATYNTHFNATDRGMQIVGSGSQSQDLIDIYRSDGLKFFSVSFDGHVFCLFGCGGGGGGGITGSGTPGALTEWLTSSSVQSAPILDLTTLTESTNPYAINGPLLFVCANSASGTTNGLLVSLDSNGNCINLPNGQTSLIEGVEFSGGGTSGNGFMAKIGPTPITFDNQTTINDYVTAGANGQAHDAGATYPTGVQVIGVVKSVNSGAGTQAIAQISILNILNPTSGGTGHVIQVNGVTTAGATDNLNSTAPAAPANNQNMVFQTDNQVPVSNITGEIPQATTAQPGIVQLAGDLGGVFTAPIVKGIGGFACTITSPVNGQVLGFNSPSTCANLFLGVPIRAVTAGPDTVLSTDRTGWIRPTSAVSTLAETLPQAGTTGFTANFAFALLNNGTGITTITPTTSTINGLASVQLLPNWFAMATSDNTNYFAALMPTASAFPVCADSGGNHLNFTAAGGILCGNSGSGSGYNQILSNGTSITQRTTVNFIPAGLANINCVDNGGATRSDCTVSASSGGASPGGVNYISQTTYTIPTTDNLIEDKFISNGGAAVAITLPQPNTISTNPFVATRTSGSGTCSPSCTTGSFTPNNGDVLIFSTAWADTSVSVSTVTDSAGTTCVHLATADPAPASSGGHTYYLSAWRCSPTTASSQSLTFTFSGTVTIGTYSAIEYSLLSFDTQAQNSVSSVASNSNLSVGPLNTAFTNEVIISAQYGSGGSTVPIGAVSRFSSAQMIQADRLVSSLGSYFVEIPVGPGTQAAALAAAGTWGISSAPGFTAGWRVTLTNGNTGLDTVTSTASTINGQTTLVIVPNETCDLTSDGTNYSAFCRTIPNQLTNGLMGQKVEIGAVNTSNAAADVTITNIVTSGAADSFYEVNAFVDCRTSVAGTETVTITYTDTNNATQTFAATTGTCNSSPADGQITSSFRAKASTNISYTTTHASTQPNYDVSVAIYQLSTK